ncbi:MFS transporter [Peristeroidobacter soli]|uniref:MFS transporter n=1 Tax=Peristeroidobacter soli TaxID=2497877 RepID=UPI001300AFE1|nr:MFS transporter [Peristeroidobacter soli]
MSSITPTEAALVPTRDRGNYAWYVLFLLTFAYTVAFIDRQVLNLLVEDIKRDLLLTDTQLSLLQGIAFMGSYIAFSPWFGRWADVGNRRNILVFGVGTWSIFSALCGLAENYWQLFLARAAVGAAEACLAPAAWSLIADYFNRERLPRAMSIYLMGPYIGGGLAMIAGGMVIGSMGTLRELAPMLAHLQPWQLTFVMIGLPGVVLAMALLTIREPSRGAQTIGTRDRSFSIREVIEFLWQGRAFYVRFYLGMALIVIVLYALPAWMPSFLMRAHGADPTTVGLRYGVLVLIMGSAGVLSGPFVDRWLARRGHADSPIRVAAIACIGLVIFTAILPLMPGFSGALIAAAGGTFFFSLPQAMSATALQLATPNRMRGIVASLYLFVLSVIGLGAAPTVVAVVTDRVFGDPSKVGLSLAVVCAISAAGAAVLLFSALPHYRRALERSRVGTDF